MSLIIGIIVGLLMLMLLVTAHEFGHFIMARRNGVDVVEFGICFPPRAIAWRKVNGKWRKLSKREWDNPPGQGLILSLNWLPIGGFCQMSGESDASTKQGGFGRATLWQKTKILFGGVAVNWLLAFVLFTVLALAGMPHFLSNQYEVKSDTVVDIITPVTVKEIIKDSPADKAGLEVDDIIESVRIINCNNSDCTDTSDDRANIVTTDDLLSFDKKYAGKEIYISYRRDSGVNVTKVKLNAADADYILGASMVNDVAYRSTWSAPIVGVGTTLQVTGETFRSVGELLYNLVSGAVEQFNPNATVREDGAAAIKKAGDAVSGPVGIVGVLFPAFVKSGLRNLIFLVALISTSLACMNVLPIPALDGGRWLLIVIYRLRRKKLTKEIEEKIVNRAFVVLLVLSFVITVLDVMRLVR